MNLKDKLKKEILELPYLLEEDFQVYETRQRVHEPLKVTTNEEILAELMKIYRDTESSTNPSSFFKNSLEEPRKGKTLRETRNLFYKARIDELRFERSPTFFSPRFEKALETMLLNKNYKFLNKDEVLKLNTALQNLATSEFEWKEYHRRLTTKESAHHQFRKNYKDFETKYNKYCYPTEEDLTTLRSDRNYMPYKAGMFGKALITNLRTRHKYKALDFCDNYNEGEVSRILISYLDPKRMFNDLARVSVKKAHEKLLNNQDTAKYNEDVLSVFKPSLFEGFMASLAIEFVYAILSHGEQIKAIDPDVAITIVREIQKLISYRGLLTQIASSDRPAYEAFIDITQTILTMFTESGFFKKEFNKKLKSSQGHKTIIELVLPDKLIVEVLKPLKLPSIVRLPVLKKKDVDTLIKPLMNGMCSLTKSNNLVKALNISRAKPHKVNVLFLALCKTIFKDKESPKSEHNALERWVLEGKTDMGTLHRTRLTELDHEVQSLSASNKSANLSLTIASLVAVQLSKTYNIGVKSYTNLLPASGLSKAERTRYYVSTKLESEYVAQTIQSKYTQSRLLLAKNLKTFPLYISDTLCIRLRKYPREHWLSRTAGQFKHLLENYSELKLTLKGFKALLAAYYQGDPDKLKKYELFLSETAISKRYGVKILTSYFIKNPLDFTVLKYPLYFMNLHLAITKAINNRLLTAVNVEVDQNASALVILSLVLRCKDMAKVCNVIGGNEKVSPYDYIREKCAEYLETQTETLNIPENKDVCDFLRKSRKVHKYAIMCFCYNQTVIGRIKDFSDTWLEEFGFLPNTRQQKVLNQFASKYDEFVEFIFPNTKRKLQIIKLVVKLVCEEAPHLSMKTLDGETLNWVFYATKNVKRKWFDVVEKVHKSYSVNVFEEVQNSSLEEERDFPRNLKIDSKGMQKRFLSYLIHSIDASILRRLINNMRIKHKVSINHLHDCVILHPNHLEALYKEIQDVYVSPELYNIVETGVFETVAHTLSPESQKELQLLKVEFLSLCDDFKDDIVHMNPQHMYSLQD